MITIPKLSELKTQVVSDLETAFGDTFPVFGKNALRIIAFVWAAKLWVVYTLVAKTQKNIFFDTADSETSGGTLERFGREKLGRDPFPAQAGQYDIIVTGTIGATIDASTTFKSDDDSTSPGKLFVLDIAHTMITTSDTVTIRALEAGLDSQLEVGDTLTSTSPIASINSQVSVDSETVTPFAAENIEDYRDKIGQAFRLEAQGGASADYILWSFDAQGVLGVYPFTASGVTSEVNVYIEATVADSIDGKGTPSGALLSDVEDVIEFDPDITLTNYERGRRPNTDIVNVLAITPNDIDIEISSASFTASQQTSIYNALDAEIKTVRPSIAGADIVEEKNDILDINKIIGVILSVVPGAIFGTVVLKVNTVSTNSITFINGEIPVLNTVTYP